MERHSLKQERYPGYMRCDQAKYHQFRPWSGTCAVHRHVSLYQTPPCVALPCMPCMRTVTCVNSMRRRAHCRTPLQHTPPGAVAAVFVAPPPLALPAGAAVSAAIRAPLPVRAAALAAVRAAEPAVAAVVRTPRAPAIDRRTGSP